MREHGRYTIERKIAEGGMAEIFLGTQHGAAGFQRPVIVKRLHAIFSASQQFRNMFVDEAHIAMSLNHSNIVQVLDLGMMSGRYYLVLELVDGWDLSRVLERAEAANMPLPQELALYIAAEVGRALAYAHGRTSEGRPLGIVHRDVSPHNILISEQGEVKLTDFGIALAENRREQTLAGIVKGKIGFMSPEQAAGQPLDARSDIFSLGATLYLLVTGKRPFAARSDLESLLRTQACEFPPPLVAKPDLHPEVAMVVMRAMQRHPADRYQSADEMVVDLERVQRSILAPAGKTELKAWLAELTKKDGVPPTSKAPPLEGSQGSDPNITGSVVVLSDSDLQPVGPKTQAELELGAKGTPLPPDSKGPASAATPASVEAEAEAAIEAKARAAQEEEAAAALFRPHPAPVDPFGPLPPTTPMTVGPVPRAAGHGPRGRTVVAVLLLAGALGVAVWAAWRGVLVDVFEGKPSQGTAGVEAPTSAPAPNLAKPEETRPGGGQGNDAASSATQVLQGDGGQRSGLAPTAENVATQPSSNPAAPQSGAEVPDDDASPEDQEAPKEKAAVKRPTVQVKLVSTPPGAHIRIGKRSFGTTPKTLTFRVGLAYKVTFEKEGYAPAERLVRVTPRRGQTIAVTLKRKKTSWWPLW